MSRHKRKARFRLRLKRAQTKRKLGMLAALVTIMAPVMILGGSSVASATQNDKIQICHRTNSVTNPYTSPEVGFDAATGQLKDNGQGDHHTHSGPVWDANTEYPPPHNGDQWGDIIPPYDYPGDENHEAGSYPGLNWTEAGQAIYNNDCNPVTPPDKEVTPATPSVTEPSCEQPNITVTPSNQEGVVWDPSGVTVLKPGESVIYTAAAAEGYVFPEGADTLWAFKNGFSETCLGPPPVEFVCPNLGADLTEVPQGYVETENGTCVKPVIPPPHTGQAPPPNNPPALAETGITTQSSATPWGPIGGGVLMLVLMGAAYFLKPRSRGSKA